MPETSPETPREAKAETARPQPRRSTRRRFILLIVLVLLVVGLWSAYWATARGMVGDVLRNATAIASAEGGEIFCGEEWLGGYPFQFELTCAPLRLRTTDGRTATTAGFRAVALAYNPYHVILEADAPLALGGLLPGLDQSLVANWRIAQASLRVGDAGLARGDIELTAPQLLLNAAPEDVAPALALAAETASFHVRHSPDSDGAADVALSVAQLAVPGLAAPVELTATATIAGGAALLGNGGPIDPKALLSPDGAIRIASLTVAGEGLNLSAQGTLHLDARGRLEGELPLTVSGSDRLPALLAPLFPEGSNVPMSLAGAIVAFGKPTTLDGAPAVIVPLAFRDGVARVGFIPIAPLTPLF
jgi:hypothetical protein